MAIERRLKLGRFQEGQKAVDVYAASGKAVAFNMSMEYAIAMVRAFNDKYSEGE